MKETLHQNGCPEHFISPQCSPSRKDREEDDRRSLVTIPYIQGVSEAVTRIQSSINVQVHMKPFPSGYIEEFSPTQRTAFLMMTSLALCTRSIVVTVMQAM